MMGQSGAANEASGASDTSGASALSMLPAGRHAIVDSLQGGHGFRSRVANLGFTAGAAITVVQNYGHGPMLVALRGTLVALGRAEAAQVLVRAGGQDVP
jgi:Fe2+ transport system protein FeoA